MRNKNVIIQKADKCNTVVITDKEKHIESVKRAMQIQKIFPIEYYT